MTGRNNLGTTNRMIPEAVFLCRILREGQPSSLLLRGFLFLLALPVLFLPVHEILVIVLSEVRGVIVHLIGILQHLLDVLRGVSSLLVVVQTQVHEPDLRVVDKVSLKGYRGAAAQGYPMSRILFLDRKSVV